MFVKNNNVCLNILTNVHLLVIIEVQTFLQKHRYATYKVLVTAFIIFQFHRVPENLGRQDCCKWAR